MIQIDPEDLWEAAKGLGDELVEAGASSTKTAKAIAKTLDDLVPLDVLVPGVPGLLLEAGDGPAFEKVVGALIKFFSVDIEKRARRRARCKIRRAKRRAAREARHG